MPSTRKQTPSTHRSNITKKQYEKWESAIIAHSNSVLPRDGSPTLVKRRKVIVVCDFNSNCSKNSFSQMVESLTSQNISNTQLPEKHRIKLHHIGNNCTEAVSLGYEQKKKTSTNGKASKIVFKHPATDFGGLTNLHQLQGECISYRNKTPYVLSTRTNTTKFTKTLMQQWLVHSHKHAFANNKRIQAGLYKWVVSVKELLKTADLYKHANINFYSLPDEIRIIHTSNDIHKRFGKYYNRIYTGDENNHATHIPPDKHTYCSIAYNNKLDTPFITPNLNATNLQNEYVSICTPN